MTLGSAIVGSASGAPRPRVVLPWEALTAEAGRPAVWVVDRGTGTVALRPIGVESYDVETLVVREGLEPGETVVAAGAQLLRPDQKVELAEGPAP